MRSTNRRNRPTSSRNLQFINQVIAQLKAEPEKTATHQKQPCLLPCANAFKTWIFTCNRTL